MKIMIVYENVPGSTNIFSVDVTDEEWQWMKLTHGHWLGGYVNSHIPQENQVACKRLRDFLAIRKAMFTTSAPNREPIDASGHDYVICTGLV